MSNQYHWVVMFDENTNKFSIDVDSTIAMIEDVYGCINDQETGHWRTLDENPEEEKLYYMHEEQLAALLDTTPEN